MVSPSCSGCNTPAGRAKAEAAAAKRFFGIGVAYYNLAFNSTVPEQADSLDWPQTAAEKAERKKVILRQAWCSMLEAIMDLASGLVIYPRAARCRNYRHLIFPP